MSANFRYTLPLKDGVPVSLGANNHSEFYGTLTHQWIKDHYPNFDSLDFKHGEDVQTQHYLDHDMYLGDNIHIEDIIENGKLVAIDWITTLPDDSEFFIAPEIKKYFDFFDKNSEWDVPGSFIKK